MPLSLPGRHIIPSELKNIYEHAVSAKHIRAESHRRVNLPIHIIWKLDRVRVISNTTERNVDLCEELH